MSPLGKRKLLLLMNVEGLKSTTIKLWMKHIIIKTLKMKKLRRDR